MTELDFEAQARAVLPDQVSAYFAAAAGSGSSLAEGIRDWAAVRFRPRVLTDVDVTTTSTSVLGTPIQTPLLIAPMAQQLAAHPDGEAAMALAAASAGTVLAVSTNSAVSFSAIAATGTPWWFQVYVMRDRALTELLVRRAVADGARALLLTVDMNALLPATVNPRDWPDSPGKARLSNLTPDELATAGPVGTQIDPSTTFETIGWLRGLSGLPVLVKGVVRGDDARRCVDEGAAGVVVSTHGGRRLGPSISSARALPEVVAAVADRAEIYADSGIRSAEHVAAALALGARAVFIGRPLLWALAAGGPAGVTSVLEGLTRDLHQVLVQLGVADVDRLGPDLLA